MRVTYSFYMSFPDIIIFGEGLPYIKTESGWKEATAYIKTEDGWKYLSAFQKKA